MFIPKVQQLNKLCDKIYWKTDSIGEYESGSMYGQFPVEGFAISVPNNKQSKFGKSLTSRYRQSKAWSNTYYIESGSARRETDDKTIIGELNGEAIWINGRLEIEKDSGRIFYSKYDDKGYLVKNSTNEFVEFKWLNSSKEKAAHRNNISRQKKLAAKKKKYAANKNKPFTEKSTESENLKDTKNVALQTKKERKPLSKVDNDAPSFTTSTLKLTGTEAESYLKDIGINLEAFGRSGSSGRTITVTKTISTR